MASPGGKMVENNWNDDELILLGMAVRRQSHSDCGRILADRQHCPANLFPAHIRVTNEGNLFAVRRP